MEGLGWSVSVFTRRQVETFVLIGVGGFIGANVRYWVSIWAAARFGTSFPWGTLIINVSGGALLGLFNGWAGNHLSLDPRIRLLIAVGFFGAYTTFSTYANETVTLLRAADWVGVWLNLLGSNVLCILGALIGIVIGSRL
ncbi:MAG: fluoride efflux transporter CrcB [Anaerolinea sp.]|nr:fluoride efflux transporter CrcB [Anaerolinea sp.]CAG0992411.1 Putative fluoride ion transporter CrcB [Anaerolineae bacterium]